MRFTRWQRLLLGAAAAVVALLTVYGLDRGDFDEAGWLLPVIVATALLFLAFSPGLPWGADRSGPPQQPAAQNGARPNPVGQSSPRPSAMDRLASAYNKLRRMLMAQFDRPELEPLPPVTTNSASDDGAAAIGELIHMHTALAWIAARTSKLESIDNPPPKPSREGLIALGREPHANERLNTLLRCFQEHTRLEHEATVAECAYQLLVTPMSADGKGIVRSELKEAGAQFQTYIEGVLSDIIAKQNEKIREMLALAGNPEQPVDAAIAARDRMASLTREAGGPYNEKTLAATIVRMSNLVPSESEPLRGRLMRAYFDFVSDQSGFARPTA
jgi:hypothetical protein